MLEAVNMNWPLSLHSSRKKYPSGTSKGKASHFWDAFWRNQDGIFPPFMFGLLIGVSLFSAISLKMGEQQLIQLQEARSARSEANREDIARGLEFSMLTETADTYDADLTLERARQYSSQTTGKTLSGSDFQLIERRTDDAYGTSQKRLLIANTDDTLRQIELAETADAKAISSLAERGQNGVTMLNTSAVRFRQVETSRQKQEAMASALYRYFSNQKRFPTPSEYDLLAKQYRLSDAWGAPFIYSRSSDTRAQLIFKTPWGEEYPVVVSLD